MHNFNRFKILVAFCFTIFYLRVYSQSNTFKVTLDAGHGGHDQGAAYNGRIEKNVALSVVLKVGKILEDNSKIQVNYTRKTDVFIDLIERANIANRSNSNIFVSIHCNANKNIVADGTETYVMGMTKIASNLEAAKKENSVITLEKDYKQKYEGFDPNSPETMIGITLMQEEYLENSISLATKVEEQFSILGKKIRGGGVKQAPYMVLHKAYMPRILIEMGFISNPAEGAILISEEGQNDIAKAIAKAIMAYRDEYFGDVNLEQNDIKPINSNQNQPQNNSPSIESKPDASKNKDSGSVIFKVQLSVINKKIDVNSHYFKGLKDITVEQFENSFKYFYGETSDYNEARKNLEEAKTKGFNTAFLIAIKNGNKISIQEATK